MHSSFSTEPAKIQLFRLSVLRASWRKDSPRKDRWLCKKPVKLSKNPNPAPFEEDSPRRGIPASFIHKNPVFRR
jgi:hypothetical protein